MQHEAFLVGAREPFDQLRIAHRTQGGNHQRLGFATGEQGRTMGLGQQPDLHINRPHRARIAAVDAGLAVDDAVPHDAFLECGEGLAHFLLVQVRLGVDERRHRFGLQFADGGGAIHLAGDLIGLGNPAGELFLQAPASAPRFLPPAASPSRACRRRA